MSYRFKQDEILLPRGCSTEDLDWLAFAWHVQDVTRDPDRGWYAHQFILAPGVLVERWRLVRTPENPFTPGAPLMLGSTTFHYADNRNILDFAIEQTGHMTSDAEDAWDTFPYVVDFTENDLRRQLQVAGVADSPIFEGDVKTLGDALQGRSQTSLRLIVDHVAEVRLRNERSRKR